MKSFSKEVTTRTKKPLEFIHANVCKPIHPNSFGKNKYFLLFIDDFSIKTRAYFFKEKYEVFSASKKLKALFEKKSDCVIMVMRFDKREIISKDLKEYCENHIVY